MTRTIVAIVTLFALHAGDESGLYAREIARYIVDPTSKYIYKPSPWFGIPGGEPTEWQLDFQIAGQLTIVFSGDGNSATILDADIDLIGNEAIQTDPPNHFVPVTVAPVTEFLEAQVLEKFATVGSQMHFHGESPVFFLKHTNHPASLLRLTGGFDHTPLDGIGMLFGIGVTLVPEPASIATICLAALLLLLARRRG